MNHLERTKLPKVSVCMPVYNNDRFVREAIESVLAQTFPDFEFLIIDNASNDLTGEIIQSFKDSRIIYYRNQINVGICKNMNACLKKATCEYVIIFSSDDIMKPKLLEEEVRVLDEKADCVFVHTNVELINEYGAVIGHHWAWPKNWRNIVMTGKEFYTKILTYHSCIVCAPTAMMRRHLIEKAGLFRTDLPLSFDQEYWMRLSLFGDIAYLNEQLLQYRLHPGQETQKYISELTWHILKAENTFLKTELAQENLSPQERLGFRAKVFFMLIRLSWLSVKKLKFYRAIEVIVSAFSLFSLSGIFLSTFMKEVNDLLKEKGTKNI